MKTFEMITKMLQDHRLEFTTVHHEVTLTSEASAKARGEDIAIGAKAIVMKIDSEFKLFVLSAALRIDSRKIKEHFKAKSIRFATADELLQQTGLVPGSIPPFGAPVLNLDLYVDTSVLVNERVAFNAGSLTDSIIMRSKDYADISHGVIFDFSREQNTAERDKDTSGGR